MSFNFWITLILLILLTVFLIKEIFPPEVTIFSVLIALVISGVITVKDAFSGFSNEGMLTIGFLFVIVGAIKSTGILNNFADIIFGKKPSSYPRMLTRILFPVAVLSAFINNTPIVAMAIPSVRKWTAKHDLPISKFLIPICYVTTLGGLCTLIGTSTNLIVHGLMIQSVGSGLGFFELTKIGLPLTIAGTIYLLFFGYKLLPNKKTEVQQLSEHSRDFVIELKVLNNYQGINKSIEEAGLRHLKGLYLFQVERNGRFISPAGPAEIIRENDRLFFTGLPETILELQKTPGLDLLKDSHFDLKNYDSDKIKSFEVVISSSSPLVGQTVKESNFRGIYNAVIIAIHRNGERIKEKIGKIRLKTGDTLIILSDNHFRTNWYHSKDFYLISPINSVDSKPKWQAYFSIISFLILLMLSIFKVMPLISAMGLAAVLLVIAGTISKENVINSVDWTVLLIIASSFGIAIGIEKSGLANFIGREIINFFRPMGIIGIISAIYLITSIYTNFITNNTAAVLMFPIALAVATELNIALLPFAVTIAIGASSSFATPISYQTNMMVYGPGGYKFNDFIKVGVPLQVIMFLITIPLIYYFYF
jgi:di/tricarboxylate transporter